MDMILGLLQGTTAYPKSTAQTIQQEFEKGDDDAVMAENHIEKQEGEKNG